MWLSFVHGQDYTKKICSSVLHILIYLKEVAAEFPDFSETLTLAVRSVKTFHDGDLH